MDRFTMNPVHSRRVVWLVVALLAVAALAFWNGWLVRVSEAINDLF